MTMTEDRKEAKANLQAEKARAKAMRPWYRKKKFIVPAGLLGLIIAMSAANAGGDKAEKVGTVGDVPRSEEPATPSEDVTQQGTEAPAAEAPKTEAPATSSDFKVGDVVKKGNFEAVVLSVNPNFKPTNEFEKPEAGNKFYAVEFQVKNNDKESEALSTLLQFKLKDSSNAQYDIGFMGTPDPRFPDGELAAGDTARGWVGFEVPTNASGMKFIFDSSVWGSGRITWNLG